MLGYRLPSADRFSRILSSTGGYYGAQDTKDESGQGPQGEAGNARVEDGTFAQRIEEGAAGAQSEAGRGYHAQPDRAQPAPKGEVMCGFQLGAPVQLKDGRKAIVAARDDSDAPAALPKNVRRLRVKYDLKLEDGTVLEKISGHKLK